MDQFQTPEDYYQAIAQELISIVNEPWIKIVVNVDLYEDSINLQTVVTFPDGSTESKIDTAATMAPEYFSDLASIISTTDKGLYKKCVFELFPDGNFDASFIY